MKKQLKESGRSTNFWNNVTTIAYFILTAVANTDFSNLSVDPIEMKDLLAVALFNAANIFYHMNKNTQASEDLEDSK